LKGESTRRRREQGNSVYLAQEEAANRGIWLQPSATCRVVTEETGSAPLCGMKMKDNSHRLQGEKFPWDLKKERLPLEERGKAQ